MGDLDELLPDEDTEEADVIDDWRTSLGDVIIDWLGFTLPCDGGSPRLLAATVAQWFGADTKISIGFGRFGYEDHFTVCGTGAVYFHSRRPDMGLHIELPSSALGAFAQYKSMSPVELISWVHDQAGRFTRVDVAVDTHSISMHHILAAYRAGQCVTKLSSHRLIVDLKSNGQTLYLGSEKAGARRRVRFYDKAAERGISNTVWTRCEVQFRSEQADQAAWLLLTADDARRLILSAVDFREPSRSDTNRTRWQRAVWWEKWLGSGERLSFVHKTVIESVTRSLEWVRRQVGPTLAFLVKASGGSTAGWLAAIVDRGFERLSPERQHLATMFFVQTGGLQCV